MTTRPMTIMCSVPRQDVQDIACELLEGSGQTSLVLKDLVTSLHKEMDNPFIPGTGDLRKRRELADMLRSFGWESRSVRWPQLDGTSKVVMRWMPPTAVLENLNLDGKTTRRKRKKKTVTR